jgi:hypothetical protein
MAKVSIRNEVGASGTIMIGGMISNADYLYEFQGANLYTTVDRMRKGDATVRVALLALKLPILSANWYIKAASESPEDKHIADFVNEQLFNEMSITWHDFLRQSLLYLDYGHFVWEIVYKDVVFQGKKYVGLRKLAPRLPNTILAWKTRDGKNGIQQFTIEKNTVDIPIEKLLILVNEKEGDNWYGQSILRSAYKHWYIKDGLYQIEAVAHERQGLGVPYVKKKPGTSKADTIKAQELLQNMRANEKGYLNIPDGWDIGFIDMKAGSIKDPQEAIKHHDTQIVKSVMAQFLNLGTVNTGSYSLSANQSELFLLSEQSIAKQIRDAVQKYVVERLVDMNFVTEKYPTIEHEKIGTIDYTKLSTAVSALVSSQLLTPDVETEKQLRKIMGLPELPENMEIPDDFLDDDLKTIDKEIREMEEKQLLPAPALPFSKKQLQQATELLFGGEYDKLTKEQKEAVEASLREWTQTYYAAETNDEDEKQYRTELASIRNEFISYKASVRKMVLQRKARGEKITKQELYKLKLDMMEKGDLLRRRIAECRSRKPKKKDPSKRMGQGHEGEKKALSNFLLAFRDGLRGIVYGKHKS